MLQYFCFEHFVCFWHFLYQSKGFIYVKRFCYCSNHFFVFLEFLEGIDSKLNYMIGLPTKYYIHSIKIFRSLIILIWNFLCTSLQRHCFHSNHLLPFTIPYHFQSQKLNKADGRLVWKKWCISKMWVIYTNLIQKNKNDIFRPTFAEFWSWRISEAIDCRKRESMTACKCLCVY